MRNEIEYVLLKRNCSAITQAATNGYGAARDDHQCSEVERVKCNPCQSCAPVHDIHGKAEDIGAIAALPFKLEVNPAEDERESNQRGDNAAPHDERMHQPARETAPRDEPLLD